MTHPAIFDVIGPWIETWMPVGSRRTCDPAPTDTDDDYLVLAIPDKPGELHRHPSDVEGVLIDAGWVQGGSRIPDEANVIPATERFVSYKKGEVNLIITFSEVFFARFVGATDLAANRNILDKRNRVALFQAVLYGAGDMASKKGG